MARVLIVDDQPDICWGLAKLTERLGHTAVIASSAEEASQKVQAAPPDVIIMDVRLPGKDGITAMADFKQTGWNGPVIVITAYGDLELAVEAIREGAFEYLTKPFDLEVVTKALERAVKFATQRPAASETTGETDDTGTPHIVGVSQAMQKVFKQIAVVAPTDAAVHITGESGTGKELVARAIHHYSRRRSGPLIAAHLAALSESLAESELFGHVRGAFTGADYDHPGLLQRAHEGTLFIDEVAEIPMNLQAKLLRAIEYREVTPVGGTRSIPCDFRIISATNRDLKQLVSEGRFRHDLYYRLVTFEITVPPLRDRREDIEPLARHFLVELCRKMEIPFPEWDSRFLPALLERPWCGNVRELRSALEHALILSRGGTLHPDLLPAPMLFEQEQAKSTETQIQELVRKWATQVAADESSHGQLYQRFLELVEPVLLETVLGQSGGQYYRAAGVLGLHRVTLRRKLMAYRLKTNVTDETEKTNQAAGEG